MIKRPIVSISLSYALLLIGTVIMIFPFLWMLSTAFKQPTEVYSLTLLPKHFTWSNVTDIWQKTAFNEWFMNSAVIGVITTITVAFFDTLAGYILAKFSFRGKGFIFILIISTLMVPTEMLIIPWYLLANGIGWVDNYIGVLFPTVITAFGIFLMRQFMEVVPQDLLDAARMDGMGELGIWLHIVLPQVRAAMVTLCLLTFLSSWNAYIWPLIVTMTPEHYTIPVGLSYFSSETSTASNWVQVMTGAWISVLPLIVLFLIFQKHIIRGIALSGLK
ncbi:carbohydrate ABC transporter permease [Paenibacillus sp. SYP-B3998]|uniref:Carbohydrate ABC transporter permease n=1 Tax=Paenibacillus sp. SYP-B3998 TaxID=2678564 RepID=A0A6G4A6N1_9BACL|nr:carbohydrate ABC transporter permease [Paenibacillus sp. SYP-B3998]NEW09481.1 carbohydrate ABC transporter permease [Paenibacillus sp. SYP-B3998]